VKTPPPSRENHPIWNLYDLQRDSRFYAKLYALKVNRLESAIFWSDVVTTVFAGSSAIAGFAFWNEPAGHQLWVIGSGAAAIIAAIKPLTHATTKLKTFQDLYSGYLDLGLDCELIAFRIQQANEYNQIHRRAVIAAKEKERAVTRRTPPQKQNTKLFERIQNQVNRELPKERFFIPENIKDDKEDEPTRKPTSSSSGA
jgi:hypothetical protein